MDMPVISSGQALVRLLELGIGGTDIEINRGKYGEAPPEQDFIVLGHEAVGQTENPGTTQLDSGILCTSPEPVGSSSGDPASLPGLGPSGDELCFYSGINPASGPFS